MILWLFTENIYSIDYRIDKIRQDIGFLTKYFYFMFFFYSDISDIIYIIGSMNVFPLLR